MALSGLQKEVLSLYRALLRASRSQPQLRQHVQGEFRDHKSIHRLDVERIEYLLRKGRKQLDIMNMEGVRKVSFTRVGGAGANSGSSTSASTTSPQ